MKMIVPLAPSTLIPLALRTLLIAAGEAKDHKAIDKIRAEIMKKFPRLYRFKDVEAERTAAEIYA